MYNGIIHIDDWDGILENRNFKLLCGHKERKTYKIFDNFEEHKDLNIKLCKTCTKKALKTGRCLVTTISAMKLKRI